MRYGIYIMKVNSKTLKGNTMNKTNSMVTYQERLALDAIDYALNIRIRTRLTLIAID